MDVKTARAAIEAILAAIPDADLPEFDRVETRDNGLPCVWFGGTGRHLGSAKRNGQRDPSVYRQDASWKAIELEMTHRADRRLFENGDNGAGIRLAKKVSR